MKKSANTSIEKIEILDESTGKIVLKERTKTLGLDNQVFHKQPTRKCEVDRLFVDTGSTTLFTKTVSTGLSLFIF
jgi:hypothetical protein